MPHFLRRERVLIKSRLFLTLTLLAPTVAFAQTEYRSEIVLSAHEWWIVVGSLIIGILVSLANSIQTSENLRSEGVESEGIHSASPADFSSTRGSAGFGAIGRYAIVGLVLGLVGAFSTQFPPVCTLGSSAAVLFLLALLQIGVFRIGDFGNKFWGQPGRIRRVGVLTAFIVALLVVILSNFLFRFNLSDNDLQMVAGVAMALAVGTLVGELLFSFGNLKIQIADYAGEFRYLSGIAMTALAIYIAGRIPQFPVMLTWSVYLIILAVYCGATSKLKQPATGLQQLLKGGGIVILIFGVMGLVSASFGYRNFSEPVSQVSALVSSGGVIRTDQPAALGLKFFTYAKSMDEFDQLLSTANATSKPVMIDYYADWCLDCKRMDRTTFKDSAIASTLSDSFIAIKVDVTDPTGEFSRAIRKRYQVFGPPALLFMDKNGVLTSNSPAYGYLDVEELLGYLSRLL